MNFSGRLNKVPISETHLKDELQKLDAHDCEPLRQRVTSEYALSRRSEWLLSRYRTLLAEHGEIAHKPRQSSPPIEGLVHAEITAEVRRLRKALIDTETKRQEVVSRGRASAVTEAAYRDNCWKRGWKSIARLLNAKQGAL